MSDYFLSLDSILGRTAIGPGRCFNDLSPSERERCVELASVAVRLQDEDNP